MAYTINHNVDTTGEQSKSITLNLPASQNYAIKADSPGEVRLVNLTSPLGREEQYTLRYSAISDIYKGSSIDRAYMTPSRRGVTALAQCSQIWTANDADNTEASQYDMPPRCNISFYIPTNRLISEADVEQLLLRTLAAFYWNDGISDIAKMARGAINPIRNNPVDG